MTRRLAYFGYYLHISVTNSTEAFRLADGVKANHKSKELALNALVTTTENSEHVKIKKLSQYLQAIRVNNIFNLTKNLVINLSLSPFNQPTNW